MGVPEWTLLVYVAQTIVFALTLIAISWQLWELRKSLRYDARLANLQYIRDLNRFLTDKPHIALQLRKENKAFTELNQEGREFYNYIVLYLIYYEWLFLLWKSGGIDKESWQAEGNFFTRSIMCDGIFKDFWEKERDFYHHDFSTHIDDQMKRLKPINCAPPQIEQDRGSIQQHPPSSQV